MIKYINLLINNYVFYKNDIKSNVFYLLKRNNIINCLINNLCILISFRSLKLKSLRIGFLSNLSLYIYLFFFIVFVIFFNCTKKGLDFLN